MKIVIQMIFGLVGVFLVKTFLFDGIEEIAWEMFWGGSFRIESLRDIGDMLKSMTFIKTVSGFIVGFIIGIVLTRLLK
ncbi:membrane protein [sediment metagenome]|uniref:Membrane protein n=1 Tax=sediment metagenome TaxID=749907 RepID=D9PMK8_9ZZZZ